MPRHKLDVIKILTITTEPVQNVISNALGPFQIFSCKGSRHLLHIRELPVFIFLTKCLIDTIFDGIRFFYTDILHEFQGGRCGEFNGSRYCQALRQMDNHEPHHARRIILNHVKVRTTSPRNQPIIRVHRTLWTLVDPTYKLILRQNRG